MAVVSPFILQSGSTYWDLRKVSSWTQTTPETQPLTVQVRFIDNPSNTVPFDQAIFETAMQACLNASV